MTSASIENTTTPNPAASFGRGAVTDVSGGGANFGWASLAVLDVLAGDAADTSVTVSLSRIISTVSPLATGSVATADGVSRATFAASSIVSRSCCGAHGLVRKRNTSLSLIDPSTASRSA